MNESPAASLDPSPAARPAKSGGPGVSCPLVRRRNAVFLTSARLDSAGRRSSRLQGSVSYGMSNCWRRSRWKGTSYRGGLLSRSG